MIPWRPHATYGRNVSGVYTYLPMPRGTQCLLQGPIRNGSMMTAPKDPFQMGSQLKDHPKQTIFLLYWASVEIVSQHKGLWTLEVGKVS